MTESLTGIYMNKFHELIIQEAIMKGAEAMIRSGKMDEIIKDILGE